MNFSVSYKKKKKAKKKLDLTKDWQSNELPLRTTSGWLIVQSRPFEIDGIVGLIILGSCALHEF